MLKLTLALVFALLTSALALAVGATPARAAGPWWFISSETAPTNLPPGGQGEVIIQASNLGDAPIDGSTTPVRISNDLSNALEPIEISGGSKNQAQVECSLSTLSCSFKGLLYPYEPLIVSIKVKVAQPLGTVTSMSDQARVEGGGATAASRTLPVPISDESAGFGIADYEIAPFNETGTPATQAGGHPFQLTTTLAVNQNKERQPVALPRDFNFHLPAGLVGNPTAPEQCTMANFFALVDETDLCSPGSAIGVATVTVDEPVYAHVLTRTVPVFNLVPAQGEPARFGFEVIGKIPVVLDTSVRSGGDYGVDVSAKDVTQTAGLLSSQVTFWGVPGDSRHDDARGWECVAGGSYGKQAGKPCPLISPVPEEPFLTLPGSCAASPQAEPVVFSMEADSWAQPGLFLGGEYAWMNGDGQLLGFEGCDALPFTPAIKVAPEEAHSAPVHEASTPTGLSVNVEVPQNTTLEPNPEGRAEADVRDTTVTLPEGVQLNPAAANGLEACSEVQIGYEGLNAKTQMQEFTPDEASCPEAAKVGIVHIKTPLLSHELEGALYLAEPAPTGEGGKNPFDSLVALYMIVEDPISGVLVKLAGEGELNPATGRVSTTFANTPQLPFEQLKLELFGGERASLTTPPRCGAYATEAVFTPWSGTGAMDVSSPAGEFEVSEGCGGSPLAFSPAFYAQVTNPSAGAFTPFTLEIRRPDDDQALSGLAVHLPAGVAALLSSLTPCQEPPAGQEWACGPESLIGRSTASSGLGGEPYVLDGDVYLTSGYDGAPFGLLVATEAKAGPFDLGMVDVRSRIDVNPQTAAVTITTDPGPRGEVFPTMLKGIPVQLKRLQVSVNRAGFEFNPTNCTSMKIEGTLSGSEGAIEGVSSPFQLGGCQNLPFAPKLSAVVGGRGSKADGTSFAVTVTSGGVDSTGVAQAGIAKVDLQLPIALSSRLPTLQKACIEAVFDANPASCDEGSVIGYATIQTPVLSNPLSGPAYLVSHGGAAFPDVEFVLQGEGIMLILDGKTDIKAGVTYSRFESTPDAPFTVFETVLPAGPHGVLAPNVPEKEAFSLCKANLAMPTEITGQNGAVLDQTTAITASGCGGVLSSKAKLTRGQLLAKALKACGQKHKHSRAKRQACERQARRRYAAKKAAHKSTAHKTTGAASRAADHSK
jgi:hypothetical protein